MHGTGSPTPYYTDDLITLYQGDAAETLAQLPPGSVNCIVTSPPYYGLRDYGAEGQIGSEPTPAKFVAALTEVFRNAHRVLAEDGTLWLNIGDSYVNAGGAGTQGVRGQRASRTFTAQALPARGDRPVKNMLGMPWRLAFALQDDGWILRNDIIWSKPNAMPESVTDRMSNRYEHVFLFSKSPRYWFDLDSIREPHAASTLSRDPGERTAYTAPGQVPNVKTRSANELGKNPGDVWTISTAPFREAHFATYPPALAARCILAGCRPGGTVLDPFSGSGTTGLAANENGRRYIGVDINSHYLDLSLRTRLSQAVLPF